jgi:AcrR family transcriptional regulator
MQDTQSTVLSSRELDIVRSAYRTMAREGSHRTSLQDIADEAGVSKALLLYHFGTKDALLLSAMKWALERTEERIRSVIEPGGSASDQISALLDAIFIDPEANRSFYLFYIDLVEHAGRVPSFGELSTMMVEIINGMYAGIIEVGVQENVLAVADIDVAARNMRALIDGTFLQWMQTEDWRDNHGTWKRHCREAVLALLGAPADD